MFGEHDNNKLIIKMAPKKLRTLSCCVYSSICGAQNLILLKRLSQNSFFFIVKIYDATDHMKLLLALFTLDFTFCKFCDLFFNFLVKY